MSHAGHRLMVRKSNPAEMRLDAAPAEGPLADGEVLLRLDRFALNTIPLPVPSRTGAVDAWGVFPTEPQDHGLVPVWGFGDVLDSRAAGIAPGARVFGCFPMADTLRVHAGDISDHGFVDVSPGRQAVRAVYRRYALCAADPHYDPALEHIAVLFQSLFVATCDAMAFLKEEAYFGARQLVVSCASSSSDPGWVWCLGALTDEDHEVTMTLQGYCDAVYSYGEVERLPADDRTLYVDLSGDPQQRRRIHTYFGDKLVYSCVVPPRADVSVAESGEPLPGPKPVVFAGVNFSSHLERGALPPCYDSFLGDRKTFIDKVVNQRALEPGVVERRGWHEAISALAHQYGYGGAGQSAERIVVRLRP